MRGKHFAAIVRRRHESSLVQLVINMGQVKQIVLSPEREGEVQVMAALVVAFGRNSIHTGSDSEEVF